jgi:hypothetical protein
MENIDFYIDEPNENDSNDVINEEQNVDPLIYEKSGFNRAC